MTVIAYKDGLMAGDSCWSDSTKAGGGLIVNQQNKLIRLRSGAIYGGAGSADDRQLLSLIQDVTDASRMPTARALRKVKQEGCEALIVLPDGTVWFIETGDPEGGIMPINTAFTAIGCGKALAMGAMGAGANARKAVEIACKYNVYCRPPVTTLRLKRS